MAVNAGGNSGNTNVQTVLTIETSSAERSMKSLKQEIKDLRDRLLNLDKGTEEYKNTLSELANKMHDVKEMNEEISRSSSDFGDRISNVTGVLQGGVGAIQGMSSALSLMGVELGNEDKLMNTLVKSMSLLQSLSAIDNANHSFRRLTSSIKLSSLSLKSLGAAMKSFATSNPFTAIFVAATALVGVLASINNKFKEMKEKADAIKLDRIGKELEIAKKESAALNQRLKETFDILKKGSSEQIEALEEGGQSWEDAKAKVDGFQKKLAETYKFDAIAQEHAARTRKKRLEEATEYSKKVILKFRKEQEALEAATENRNEAAIASLETRISRESEYLVFIEQESNAFNAMAEAETQLNATRAALWSTENEEVALQKYQELYDVVSEIQKQYSSSTASRWPLTSPDNVKTLKEIQNAFYGVQEAMLAIRKDVLMNGPIQMMGPEEAKAQIQAISLAQAETDKLARAERNKRKEQHKQYLNDLLAQYRRYLQQRQKENELARKKAQAEAKEKYTRTGPEGKLLSASKNWGPNGIKGYSDEIRTAIAERDRLRESYAAEQKELQANINLQKEYIEKLKAIEKPTKEVKEAIEDAEHALQDQELALRELNMQRAEDVRNTNLEIDALVAEYRQRKNNATAIEAETEAMRKLLDIEMKYNKKNRNGASWWNGWKEGNWKAEEDADKNIEIADEQIKNAQAGIESVGKQLDELEERKKYQMEHGIFDESKYLEEKANLLDQSYAYEDALRTARDKKEEASLTKRKLLTNKWVNFSIEAANTIANLLNFMSDQDDISFEEQKKLKTAAAVIEMLSGAVTAYSSAMSLGPIAGPILGGINAAAVIAMGLKNIQQIKNTTKESSGGANASSVGATTIVKTPPEIVNLNATNDEMDLPDQRVYVVESDITSAQRRVQVIENNSQI